MKVKALKLFRDKGNGLKTREINDVFEVSPKRFKEINSTHHGIMVEEIKEDKEHGKGN